MAINAKKFLGLVKLSLNAFTRVESKSQGRDFLRFYSATASHHPYKLVEVGVLGEAKNDNYETGQVFLHKVFGYRGVVLLPWKGHLFDKTEDIPTTTAQYDKSVADELDRNGPPEREKAKTVTYYQVLIDNRDIPYIRAHPESVTLIKGDLTNKSIYSIHGLDYVSHSDVLPYTSTEKAPIEHNLLDTLLTYNPETKPSYQARDALKSWKDNHFYGFELSDVYVRITNNIRVTVIPFYIGVKEDQRKKIYWWRYSIRIENLGDQPATLRERHWRIFSQAGTFETVRGKGVVGFEPYLSKDYPAFQYSSHVNLQAPSGHMWGTFKMERDDGTSFEVRIPSFYLECKEEDKPSP